MSQSLKEQAVKGTGWSALERFATQGVSFLIQLVLARLLMPEDYGAIAMLAIFLQVAQVFIDSGFANALIKKIDCKDIDYSTVFYYNLAISVAVYFLFWGIAPLVATFYNLPLLKEVMRVISITLIINALCIVQRTQLVKAVDFKTQTKVSLSSVVVSGFIGIAMAYKGFGVWSLCGQSIICSLMQWLLYSYYVRWNPALSFSKQSFREMFNFGSKLLGASLISVIYNNIYTIVIGKRFDSTTLGLYSRADQFATFPSTNVGQIIARVTLPVLSKIQEDDNRLIQAYRKIIRYGSLVIAPLMLGLCAISKPLILSILTEKWVGVVPFMQVLCLGLVFDHMNGLNLNLLYVKGRSDLVLRLEVIKKIVAISILFISIPFGVLAMCVGRALYCIIAVFINTYYTKKLINLSVWQQFCDVLPYVGASVVMAVMILLSSSVIQNSFIQLMVGFVVGFVIYGLFTRLFFMSDIKDVLSVIKK